MPYLHWMYMIHIKTSSCYDWVCAALSLWTVRRPRISHASGDVLRHTLRTQFRPRSLTDSAGNSSSSSGTQLGLCECNPAVNYLRPSNYWRLLDVCSVYTGGVGAQVLPFLVKSYPFGFKRLILQSFNCSRAITEINVVVPLWQWQANSNS